MLILLYVRQGFSSMERYHVYLKFNDSLTLCIVPNYDLALWSFLVVSTVGNLRKYSIYDRNLQI